MIATDVQLVSAEMLATHDRLQRTGAIAGQLSSVGRLVGRMGQRLARPPRLVLLGEFNSGKTTLANLLLDNRVLPTSFLNNTRIPVLARYARQTELLAITEDGDRQPIGWEALPAFDLRRTRMLQVNLPLDKLKTFEVIDTPGLSTGQVALDEKSRQAAQAANIAVWCTPATQAWKASERSTWLSLPHRLRESAILAVTLIDNMATASDRARLRDRMMAEAMPYFSRIVMISARDALRARLNTNDDGTGWAEAGGSDLQAAIATALARQTAHRVSMAQRILQKSISKAGIALPARNPCDTELPS